jgi:hypothetical protein
VVAPGRADRLAEQVDDVRLLAVDRDFVGEVVRLRGRLGDVLRPERRRQTGGDDQQEDDAGGEGELVAAQSSPGQPPGTEARALQRIVSQLLRGVERELGAVGTGLLRMLWHRC